MPMSIRQAARGDLPAAVDVAYRWEVRGDPSPPPPPGDALLAHVLATGQVWVAEQDRQIVGSAASIVRSNVAYLTDLFVLAERQSGGIGRALLEAALPRAHDLIRCTLASTDPRAQALYTRSGMQPLWPNFWLRGQSAQLRELPTTRVRAVEAPPEDAEWIEWDAAIGGRRRPEDLAFWVTERRAQPLWLARDGARVGYGLVQRRSPAAIWFPESFTVGLVGARTAEDARACLLAAVDWARARAEIVRPAVPGPHPALKPLLDAGFIIRYVETFCSAAAPCFDPRRYSGAGDLL